MALWIDTQLLGMRDFEMTWFVNRNQRVPALSDMLIEKYVQVAHLAYGVKVNPLHVVRSESSEDDKTYKWTYSWHPATGAAYIPKYDREFTLKTMTNSLPKGVVKLRVRDELKLTMEDDSRRDRFFELSSWDDANDRWIYKEVPE